MEKHSVSDGVTKQTGAEIIRMSK